MTLGERIGQHRGRLGLSQSDLAEKLEVSRQSVSKWETDTSVPELEKLVKMCQLFGVTLDELVRGVESEHMPDPQPSQVQIVYREAQPVRRTVGILLLALSGVVFVLCLALGQILFGLIMMLPFLLPGILCLTMKRPGLWCLWSEAILLDAYFYWATGCTWMTLFTPLEWNYSPAHYITGGLMLAWRVLLVGVTAVQLGRRGKPAGRRTMQLLAGAAVVVLLYYLVAWCFRVNLLWYLLAPLSYIFSQGFLLRMGNYLLGLGKLALVTALLTQVLRRRRQKREEPSE